MDTTKTTVSQDPLGPKRFALTESAYDLLNSLVGIYSRLIDKENDRVKPDATMVTNWHNRILKLNALYYEEDWSDLLFVQHLIDQLYAEYRQAVQQETAKSSSDDHDTHTKPRTIPAV